MLDPHAVTSFNLCHNIIIDQDDVYVLSIDGAFAGVPGCRKHPHRKAIKPNGFTRGFAGELSDYVIGQSDIIFKRQVREKKTTAQSWLETNTTCVDVPVTGMIRDIRRTDGVDLAHHNKHLFPFKDAR